MINMNAEHKHSDINKKEQQIYDIIACYWCDLFFNFLYFAVLDSNEVAEDKSLTDSYIKAVRSMCHAIKNNKEFYSKAIGGIYNLFKSTSSLCSFTFDTYLDTICSAFIPNEIFTKMTKPEKDKILSFIFGSMVDRISCIILLPDMLSNIMDKHDQMSANTLREKLTDVMVDVRYEYYTKFITGYNENTWESVALKLKSVVKKQKKEYDKLLDKYNEVIEELNELKSSKRSSSRKSKHYSSSSSSSSSSTSSSSSSSSNSSSSSDEDTKSIKSKQTVKSRITNISPTPVPPSNTPNILSNNIRPKPILSAPPPVQPPVPRVSSYVTPRSISSITRDTGISSMDDELSMFSDVIDDI